MNTRKKRLKRAFWWSFFAVWLVLTVFLSSQSGYGSSSLSRIISVKLWHGFIKVFGNFSLATFHFYFRKFAHAFVHFVLAFVTVRASLWSFPERASALRFALIFSTCIALFDEAIQLVSPGRSSAFFDAGLNLSGVIVGTFLSACIRTNND